MPEGDTIHRAAARLRPALEGRVLRRFAAPRLAGERPCPGVAVVGVEAVGKHLLVHFDDGLSLQIHMRMSGSWHLYRTGERWQKPAHLARVEIEVDEWVAVCFSAPVVRTYRRRTATSPGSVGSSDPVAHLGPDLCRADADLDEAIARLAAYDAPAAEIGAVLLDQRVASGIGNVYKSEVLFACRIDPFTAVGDLGAATHAELVRTASRLLRANLDRGPRVTVAGVPGGLAVYRRSGRPCHRCGTRIRMRRQGEQARSTYWCPTCQAR